jgi:hypothetical protein
MLKTQIFLSFFAATFFSSKNHLSLVLLFSERTHLNAKKTNRQTIIGCAAALNDADQGCQIFLRQYTKTGEKRYQITTKLPKDHKTYQMALVY